MNGVLVTEVGQGSPAWKAGLRPDDVILSVNRVDVSDVRTFVKLVAGAKGPLVLGVMRGNRAAYLIIK